MKERTMPKLCEYKDCRKRATYGPKRLSPQRCKEHCNGLPLVSLRCNCGKARPTYNLPGETKCVCCAACRTNGMVNVKDKVCRCGKCRPTYNLPGERAACCAACRTDDMVDVVSKACRCGKAQPTYNLPGERAACCAACRTDDMVNVKDNMCRCGKCRPTYNLPGERAACCVACRTDDMVDVVNKACRCGKAQPTYNLPGERAACCAACRTDDMVNVKDNMCRCGKSQPTYNLPGERAACCAACRTNDMVDIVNKACRCGKCLPIYNLPGERAACCATCRTNDMVNVKNKMCRCGKARPSYNSPGEKTPVCCTSCRTEEMVNVVSKACPGQEGNCTTIGNKRYKGYCTWCFQHEFPLDPLTFQIHCKTKEIAVRDFINANFDGFQHDKPLYTDHCNCTVRRRIDHRCLIGNTLLAIETDENHGHRYYNKDDERNRYDDLYMSFSGKFIYIRFNPDSYKDKNGKKHNPDISTRLRALKMEIEKQMQRIENDENEDLVDIVYMYYDEKQPEPTSQSVASLEVL
jgi:hypothetical protein